MNEYNAERFKKWWKEYSTTSSKVVWILPKSLAKFLGLKK